MKISYVWLQDYFDKQLPAPEKIGELLTMHAFEIESIDKIGADTLLDVKILPDRSHDCLSHIGIAREVALFSGVSLKSDVINPKALSVPESNVLKVEIEDTKLCKRFSSLVIENVEVKESPEWLQKRLATIGQRSINNIVDATNYVLFALGQPLHAYDRDLLTENGGGWKIVVRKAKAGESLMALDNKEYTLADELVIVDGNANKVLGIAGIKGGKASEITKKTKDIVLEAANFEPVNIRKTSKKLGLRTDASVRFENEITPELTVKALKMVADLIMEIAGTDETQVEGLVDVYPRRANPYKVGVSLFEIRNLLGLSLDEAEVISIFQKRGFEFSIVDPRDIVTKFAPTFLSVPYKLGASILHDAPRCFDCSSFTSYLYTQAGIAIPRMTVDQLVMGEEIAKEDLQPGDLVYSNSGVGTIHKESIEFMPGTPVETGVDHVGIYMGYDKIIHASKAEGCVVEEKLSESKGFANIAGYRRFIVLGPRIVVTIPNERLDLRIREDLIEEIGRIYGYENLVAKPLTKWEGNIEIEKSTYYANVLRKLFVDNGFSEVITYAFRAKGEVELANPIAKDKPFLRSNLAEGLEESLKLNTHNADLLGLAEVKLFEIGNVFTKDAESLHIAFTGEEMVKKITEIFGFDISFKKIGSIFEIDLSDSIEKLPEPHEVNPPFELSQNKFKPFSEYPFVLRDIAVFVPEGESENIIIETIQKEAGNLLVSYRLFDTFTKEFAEGKKTSYAYRLVFQSMEKTLSDEEINPIMEKATAILNGKQGFQVR